MKGLKVNTKERTAKWKCVMMDDLKSNSVLCKSPSKAKTTDLRVSTAENGHTGVKEARLRKITQVNVTRVHVRLPQARTDSFHCNREPDHTELT